MTTALKLQQTLKLERSYTKELRNKALAEIKKLPISTQKVTLNDYSSDSLYEYEIEVRLCKNDSGIPTYDLFDVNVFDEDGEFIPSMANALYDQLDAAINYENRKITQL